MIVALGFQKVLKTRYSISIAALKNYNLEGEGCSGQTLVGNWFEDRQWEDHVQGIKRTAHGSDLTAQPGYEGSVYESTTHDTYRPPDVRHKKVPPRQATRERCDLQSITRDIRQEELAAVDNSIHFTRGRFLVEPQIHDDLDLGYLSDEPITIHSEKPHNFGKDSHFTQPIQHYHGHRRVKDD
jgi:hypothetical protein